MLDSLISLVMGVLITVIFVGIPMFLTSLVIFEFVSEMLSDFRYWRRRSPIQPMTAAEHRELHIERLEQLLDRPLDQELTPEQRRIWSAHSEMFPDGFTHSGQTLAASAGSTTPPVAPPQRRRARRHPPPAT